MTQNIKVVYVKEPGTEPCMNDILLAIVDALGIEIIHADRHGNSVRIKIQDDIDIEVIRHVLHKAFPHKLSVFGDKPKHKIIRVIYVEGASICPSAIAIMSELMEELSIEVIDAHTDPGTEVTLKLGGDIDIDAITHVLDKAFNHSLLVACEKPEADTITAAEDILREAALLMRAKNADYGDSWRLMRLSSITDQILVKINRVRTIEESNEAPKVSEGVESEYRDILNYSVFAILKLREENARSE